MEQIKEIKRVLGYVPAKIVMEELGMSTKTLRKWHREKGLGLYRIKNKLYLKINEVNALIESSKIEDEQVEHIGIFR